MIENNIWRVNIHTVNGWIEHGQYRTYRGAIQALRLSRRTVVETPLASRVGGTDNTVSVISKLDDDWFERQYRVSSSKQGCQMELHAWHVHQQSLTSGI